MYVHYSPFTHHNFLRARRGYTRESIMLAPRIDIHDSSYPSHLWLYIFCGLLDSMWQTTAYWFMGAMSNDPAKLANFSGFCACLELLSPSFVVTPR